MIVIPAIDVRGGHGVRLRQGDYGQETLYDERPATRAQAFARAGARRVHIVDLDAARGLGDPRSRLQVEAVVSVLVAAGVEAQVGGGIRSRAAAERWFAAGVSAVVLGSVAVNEPEEAERICQSWPGRVWLGLDVRGEAAQSQGWTRDAGSASLHLSRWVGWPAAGLIRTEVSRDGVLEGPDLAGLRSCVEIYPGPVVASGGVGCLADIVACAEAGAAGVIVGRALYEGRVDLAAAVGRFPDHECTS